MPNQTKLSQPSLLNQNKITGWSSQRLGNVLSYYFTYIRRGKVEDRGGIWSGGREKLAGFYPEWGKSFESGFHLLSLDNISTTILNLPPILDISLTSIILIGKLSKQRPFCQTKSQTDDPTQSPFIYLGHKRSSFLSRTMTSHPPLFSHLSSEISEGIPIQDQVL